MKYIIDDDLTPVYVLQQFVFTNEHLCRNVLVSHHIFNILQCSSTFFHKNSTVDTIRDIGFMYTFSIYIEYDNYLKDKEYEFFDSIEDMKYNIKTKDRQAKLERIVNGSSL